MAQVLPIGGYYDTPLWGTMANAEGEKVRVLSFPITRYDNVLGRPKMLTNMETAVPSDFAFLKVGEREVPDDVIFQKADQTW
jgi:hypothetical protein